MPLLTCGGPPRYDLTVSETVAEHSLKLGLNPSHHASTIIRPEAYEAALAPLQAPATNYGMAFRFAGLWV